jgi:hypothetical protein
MALKKPTKPRTPQRTRAGVGLGAGKSLASDNASRGNTRPSHVKRGSLERVWRYLPFGAVLVLGCGSRSGLLDATRWVPESGGSGGSTPVGGAGGTAGSEVGGSGGSTQCTTLTRLESSVLVDKPSDDSDVIPELTRITGDDERVALAFIRGTHQGTDAFSALQHVAFSAWGGWPPSAELGPTFTAFVAKEMVKEIRVAPSLPSEIAVGLALPKCIFAPHVPLDTENTVAPGPGSIGSVPSFLRGREPDLFAFGWRGC